MICEFAKKSMGVGAEQQMRRVLSRGLLLVRKREGGIRRKVEPWFSLGSERGTEPNDSLNCWFRRERCYRLIDIHPPL